MNNVVIQQNMLYYDVFFSNTTNAPTKISSLSATIDVPRRRDDYNQQLRFFFAVKSLFVLNFSLFLNNRISFSFKFINYPPKIHVFAQYKITSELCRFYISSIKRIKKCLFANTLLR